jgi:hypothetical protein
MTTGALLQEPCAATQNVICRPLVMPNCAGGEKLHPSSLEPLDRAAIVYLTLPLFIFLLGWFEWWAALPLIACAAYALKPLAKVGSFRTARLPITLMQLLVAGVVGCGWTALGGTGHIFFANYDWVVRDAVFHDLVTSSWPVGYGVLDGKETLLRAPVAYYLPAAIIGKLLGLPAAHLALAVWTAIGATLWLLQVLSLTRSRLGVAIVTIAVVVLFSGLDIIGSVITDGSRFFASWNISQRLDLWAGSYQYSSMTTQLFWAPNHALGGWLLIGMLYRDEGDGRIDSLLPIVLVAAAFWSPLSAIGLVPFVLWKLLAGQPWLRLLEVRVWAPACLVGIAVAAYLVLDPSNIPKGWSFGKSGISQIPMDLLRQVQFFLLEAGFIGFAILSISRSKQVVLALVILALLPLINFGAGNDLVMRASIPSLTVLAIASGLALVRDPTDAGSLRKKVVLCCLLAIGAVTAAEEIVRAVLLPSWPIDQQATLIQAARGDYPAHYVARMSDQSILLMIRTPHPILSTNSPQVFTVRSNLNSSTVLP